MHSLLCFIFDALKNLLNIPLIIIKYLFFYFNIYMSLRDRYKDGQVLGGIISFYLDVRNKTVCRNKRVQPGRTFELYHFDQINMFEVYHVDQINMFEVYHVDQIHMLEVYHVDQINMFAGPQTGA